MAPLQKDRHIPKQPEDMTKKPVRFEFEYGFKQFSASLLVLVLFFVLPIVLINNWSGISKNINTAFDVPAGKAGSSASRVAGVSTDNSGRYFTIPLINFHFDTTMREPSTISFLFGAILLVISILLLLILFADFRKKEKKYR